MTESDGVERTDGRWCLGRASQGRAALADTEIAAMRARSKRSRMLALLPLPAWLLVFPAILGLFTVIDRGPGWLRPVGLTLIMFSLLLGLPVAILLTRDRWRDADDDVRDAEHRHVELFGDESAAADDEDRVGIAVGVSGRVIRGPAELIGTRVQVRRVSPPTGLQVSISIGNGDRVLRRRLSDDETEELRAAIRRWKRVRPASILAVCGMALLVLAFVSRSRGPIPFGDWFGGIGWFLICILTVWNQIRRIRTSQAMERDLADRGAVTVHHGDETIELLPHSGVAWWVNGAPAEWRNAGG